MLLGTLGVKVSRLPGYTKSSLPLLTQLRESASELARSIGAKLGRHGPLPCRLSSGLPLPGYSDSAGPAMHISVANQNSK